MNHLTTQEALLTVFDAVALVAPDVAEEVCSLARDVDMFEALELDSMDHVNIMTALWERTGVEIAERDYGHLRNIDAIADHISVATT